MHLRCAAVTARVSQASAGDYSHCEWVSKAYRNIVTVAVCKETSEGLHGIGVYVMFSTGLFFLTFFLQLHIVGQMQAKDEFGKNYGQLVQEEKKMKELQKTHGGPLEANEAEEDDTASMLNSGWHASEEGA